MVAPVAIASTSMFHTTHAVEAAMNTRSYGPRS
jgi:hypothetical protein